MCVELFDFCLFCLFCFLTFTLSLTLLFSVTENLLYSSRKLKETPILSLRFVLPVLVNILRPSLSPLCHNLT